jgi:non-heme chloroperoxidase
MQSGLSWMFQLEGTLSEHFFIVAPDLRGHGHSGKPPHAGAYDSTSFGQDMHAILSFLPHLGCNTTGVHVVAWSYGGYILGDYLRQYAEQAHTTLGKIILVNAGIVLNDAFDHIGPGFLRHSLPMNSDQPALRQQGTEAFVQACFYTPPTPAILQTILEYNALTPPFVRQIFANRRLDYTQEYTTLQNPLYFLLGRRDSIILNSMSAHTVQQRAHTKGLRTEQVIWRKNGHALFIENPQAFAQQLMDWLC